MIAGCIKVVDREEHAAHGKCPGAPAEGVMPTPEQTLAWLRVASDDDAIDALSRWSSAMDEGQRCFIENHGARIADLSDIYAMVGGIEYISAWIDNSYPEQMAEELWLRRRINKLAEEVGEVHEALSGVYGENPRKGVTHTMEQVEYETLDVAAAALGAYWSMTHGNNPLRALVAHVEHVEARARAANQRETP